MCLAMHALKLHACSIVCTLINMTQAYLALNLCFLLLLPVARMAAVAASVVPGTPARLLAAAACRARHL